MMSVEMRKYYNLASRISSGLTTSDFSSTMVIVNGTDDCSHFEYDNAFYKECDDWYLVFTEHYGFHVFPKDGYNISLWRRAYSEEDNSKIQYSE